LKFLSGKDIIILPKKVVRFWVSEFGFLNLDLYYIEFIIHMVGQAASLAIYNKFRMFVFVLFINRGRLTYHDIKAFQYDTLMQGLP